jgi:glycosyltransferase involved in cell wall biosynthesis
VAAPLRLLIVSSYYHPATVFGGPVPAMASLNKTLGLSGHKVTVFTTDANGTGDLNVPTGQPVAVDGLPVTYFPRWWFGRAKKPFSLFFSPELGRALRQIRPGDYDLFLIHSIFGEPGRLAANAARRTGTPYICYTHGTFEPWAIRHKYWKKRLYLALIEGRIFNGAAGMVVCNNAETEQLRRLGIKSQTRRIPWGVEIPGPEGLPSRSRLGEMWPPLAGRPFLLFLSRLHPKKGLDLLIPAFGALTEEFPDWLLVLAGPGEGGYRQTLEKMVRELHLDKRVIFTGLVTGEAKAALLAHADLFVLPSYSEGFPVVVSEALSYGRPVVITTTCYVPEVAEQGAGLVTPPEKTALTPALREMLRDEAGRRRCSAQALEVARKHFTWEAVARQSLAFYREAINRVKE